MQFNTRKIINVTLSGLMIIALSGCSLPRSGPSKSQLLSGSQDRRGDALVVEITTDVIEKNKIHTNVIVWARFFTCGVNQHGCYTVG